MKINHLLISEVQRGTEGGGANDEFVELYNPTDQPISLAGFALKKKSSSGSEANLVSSGAFSGTIGAHGFFLIAHKNYQGAVAADLAYSANSNNLAYTSNGVVLYGVGGALVDYAGWGEIEKGQSYERRAFASGSCVSAQNSGELLGNGFDTDGQSDFEIRSVPQPQNSASGQEP